MDINDLLIFVKVAQCGSFSKAARLMRIPLSTVSRRVSTLEKALNAALLVRTTRSLKLTEIGKSMLEHGQIIATELEKAQSYSTRFLSVPQGTIKMTATTDFGNQFLAPLVSEFLNHYPKVNFDIVLTERVVGLVEEGFDLAIRMGDLEHSSLKSRKLGHLYLQLYASPSYLKSKQEPKTWSDLLKHNCLIFHGENQDQPWIIKGPSGEKQLNVLGQITSNNVNLIKEFALSGKGIALLPYFLCREDLLNHRLKVVLPEWSNPSGPIYLVYPAQKLVLPKVRVFVDFLAHYFSKVEWKHKGQS